MVNLELKKKKNWINLDIKCNIDFEKGRDSFIINKLKQILFNWNIIFFKLSNLKKKKIKITKIKLYKNTFILFFFNIKKLNFLLKENSEIFEKKLNVLSINYNGYYINYEIIKKLNFSNLIFEKVYINLIIKLICSLIIKVLLNILIKSILYLNIKYSLLNLEVQKYV